MMDNTFNYLVDEVSNCHSFIFSVRLGQYLDLIKSAYQENGNIQGQRAPLASQSAKKIRERMRDDFSNGSVLPAVVVGLSDSSFDPKKIENVEQLISYLDSKKSDLSLIDGMQRTTAMIDAGDCVLDRFIRIELWLTESISKLIYRMLVLNTGQVPWTMKRQLEVVLNPIKTQIASQVPHINLLTSNDSSRRSQAGFFQADKIIEAFLVFGSRSEKANTRDAIAEEYTKLDFIESTSKQELMEFFIEYLKRVVEFDRVVSKIPQSIDGRFKKGLDLLTSAPFLMGITAAFGIKILGRPKRNLPRTSQQESLNSILSSFDNFIGKLNNMQPDELSNFINLASLNSYLPSNSSSKIGDVERSYFNDCFKVLIEDDFEVDNMEICWGH
ncbi:hypothetical protein [Pseudoalteromonas sp. T1lg75]|uniref:hypothetical protein n=1 Tax=Pseudoalteromonas sp. T1lg75 TaxID=2077102 RepID=UPI000CF6C7B6|nr:hypothetical protein [Pseudoalteromonas sp. T1lg75]